MTEVEARALLRSCDGLGGVEAWVAAQPWQAEAAPGGWRVVGELQGWWFRLAAAPAGLRLAASAPSGGEPARWLVLAR